MHPTALLTCLVLAATAAPTAAAAHDEDSTLPPGFVQETVVAGLSAPTCMVFAPDGRLFVAEHGGTIQIIENGALVPQPLMTVPISSQFGEHGILGMTIDPSFDQNGWIYLYYVPPGAPPHNRVSRFTVTGNTANPASEFVVWENPAPSTEFHHGGGINFLPDGTIAIPTGDGRDGANAQKGTNLFGKVLRMAKDGSIPPDNPFVGTPGIRNEIWALGVRNPFRSTVDPLTGDLWIGDVGGNFPSSWEEAHIALPGINLGWPDAEGPVCHVPDCSGFSTAAWSWQHSDPAYAPTTPQGSVTLGPVYRGSAFPSEYHGNLFVADYANRWIRRLIFDAQGAVVDDPIFFDAPGAGTIVDLIEGPNGALWYATIGLPFSGTPDVAGVHRILHTGTSNLPPVAVANGSPRSGLPTLDVQFSSTGSFDPDQGPGPLGFFWDFGDGQTSTQANPLHPYPQVGRYEALLMVDDGAAQVTSGSILIQVGNAPVASIDMPSGGHQYTAGELINFAGSAIDVEDGNLPPSAFEWNIVLVHLGHVHPFLGPLTNTTGGQFTIPATGHPPQDTFYRILLTVTDSDGLQHTKIRNLTPVDAPIEIESFPAGVPIALDGQNLVAPGQVQSLQGFVHGLEAPGTHQVGNDLYLFHHWTQGGARVQAPTAPAGGATWRAIYVKSEPRNLVATIPIEARQCDWYPSQGQQFRNHFDPNGLCAGSTSGETIEMGLQFPLDLPQGAVILSAEIEVRATNDQSGSPLLRISAYDSVAAPPFIDGNPIPPSQWAPLLPDTVDWPTPTFQNNQLYRTPDLTALVQALVNRPDWQANTPLGFVLETQSAGNQWRCVRNWISGQPPTLRVTYAASPQRAVLPDMKK